MKISIKITKEVLAKSMLCGTSACEGKNTENCAFAVALQEAFPKAHVGYSFLNLVEGHANPIEMTEAMTEFVLRFDSLIATPEERLLLPEFSFDIEVPDSVIESIGIEQAKEIISKSSTLELIES